MTPAEESLLNHISGNVIADLERRLPPGTGARVTFYHSSGIDRCNAGIYPGEGSSWQGRRELWMLGQLRLSRGEKWDDKQPEGPAPLRFHVELHEEADNGWVFYYQTKEERDALQVESAAGVPLREQPIGSPEVPSGDPQGGEAAGAGEEEVPEAPLSKGKRKK